ncbi:WD40 repeat [Trypanosoma melophagium]|uniref:WD40 repeat n=1 Tax=Trypanosoma melophagium TaxID=715481 RepID=UPI00351A7BA1|nr:WD40 repeat [Trypanosoma melophagium]
MDSADITGNIGFWLSRMIRVGGVEAFTVAAADAAAYRAVGTPSVLSSFRHLVLEEALRTYFTSSEEEAQRFVREVNLQRERVQQLIEDVSLGDVLVTLNVGGTMFTISRQSLCAEPESMLALLLCEWMKVERDAGGFIFLDRSPHLFSEILSYLRLKSEFHISGSGGRGRRDGVMDEDSERGIMTQLTQTNWRYLTSADLHGLIAEANYYNLKRLEFYLVQYTQRRWIEYGTFFSSGEVISKNTGESSDTRYEEPTRRSSMMTDAVICLDYDNESGICAAGRGNGLVTLYLLPSVSLLKTLRGHTNCVTAIVITSRRLFSSGRDGFIFVWHGFEGSFAPICSLHAHQGFANDLLYLPDQLSLFSCGEDGLICVYILSDRLHPNTVGNIVAPGPLRSLAAYHQYIFASCRETIVVLDTARGDLLPVRGEAHAAPIRCLSVCNPAGLLASGDWEGVIYVWCVRGVKGPAGLSPLRQVRGGGGGGWVAHLAFVGDLLAAVSGSGVDFIDSGPQSVVVRHVAGRGPGVRVVLALESINCLLLGDVEGGLTALHSRLFAQSEEMMGMKKKEEKQ